MIYQWFERVGQSVAPDANYHHGLSPNGNGGDANANGATVDPDDAVIDSVVWDAVAPDPRYREIREERRRSGGGSSSSSPSGGGAPQTPREQQPPPPAGANNNTKNDGDGSTSTDDWVECEHCHQQTPAKSGGRKSHSLFLSPPSSARKGGGGAADSNDDDPLLAEAGRGVAQASRSTLEVMGSPAYAHKKARFKRLFALVSVTEFYGEKAKLTTAKLLERDPTVLLEARATDEGLTCPKSYTPLMVVALHNNLEALDLFLGALLKLQQQGRQNGRVVQEYLHLTNLDGENAMHIAAKQLNFEFVRKLKAFEEELNALLEAEATADNPTTATPLETPTHGSGAAAALTTPSSQFNRLKSPPLQNSVDILGRTPLGAGLMSPLAFRHESALLEELLTANDASIYGKPVPAEERSAFLNMVAAGTRDNASVAVSTADMPGLRVDMEDTTMVRIVTDDDNSSNSIAVLGVFDGHGDAGLCSRAAAERLEEELVERRLKILECLRKDSSSDITGDSTAIAALLRFVFWTAEEDIRQRKIPGGSTGVVALITSRQIVVANVGDSRCVLVQQPKRHQRAAAAKKETDDVTAGIQQLSLSEQEQQDASQSSPSSQDQECDTKEAPMESTIPKKQNQHQVTVKALSEDHNPDLETERPRIENAGVQVEEIRYEQDGKEKVVHKLVKVKSELGDTLQLAMSRSFGDFEWKKNDKLSHDQQAVISIPDVVVYERDPEQDAFLVLACDGIWDVMTNEDVGTFVAEKAEGCLEDPAQQCDYVLAEVADQLLRECFDKKSKDNLSVVLVALGSMADKVSSGRIRKLDKEFEQS